MKNRSVRKWIGKVALGCLGLVLSVGTILGGKSKTETYAVSFNDTTSYVSVGELFDTDSQSINVENYHILLKYITGNANATYSDITSLASSVTDASVMRAKTLDAGDGYSAKSSSQDIVVRLGGLDWQVMYLSTNKSDEPILTLWLDNNKQDAWADRSATEGTYYGFIDGALYSDWSANWYNSTVGTSPSNMYGASYINAVTLNNGGVYATNTSGSYTSVEKNAENPFALFTMEEFGLTEYIEKPRNVSWQENQSAKSIISTSYNYPNEAWSKDTTDDGFYSADYNYAELNYSDAWADSYIWLPSESETGYSDTNGLWKASVNQRKNYDGSTTSSQGSVGSSSGTAYPYSWLRSGHPSYAGLAYYLYPSGSAYNFYYVTYSYAVRPSLHLNLNSVELSSTRVSIAGGEMTLGSSGEVYNGKAKTPEVTVTLAGSPLARDTDYILTYSLNGVAVDEIKSVGEYTITAKGTGDYRGKLTATYTVTAQGLANISISTPSDQTYTGSAIAPTLTITDGDVALTQDTDYTIAYTNNTNVGTATITITGKDNYTGEVTRTFKITALAMSSSNISVSGVSSMTYTGSALSPTPTITYNGNTLILDTDYTLSYKNNTNVGTATITITGKGNYTGTREVTYQITARSISSGTLTIGSATYTGTELIPTTTLVVDSKTLVKGTDYIVTCTNNVNSGTAMMEVTGKGNYSGTISKSFTISRRSISEATIDSIADQQYTGSYIRPALNITYNGMTLTQGTDYSCGYSSNVDLTNTATVTITGLDNYTGEVTKTFSIVAHNISLDTFTLATNTFSYTGESVKLEETLKVGTTTLLVGTDYTLAIYKDSVSEANKISEAIDVGSYILVATGKANYTGSVNTTFSITARDLTTGSIILASDTISYTGEARIPAFQVKLGSLLIDSSNYDVKTMQGSTEVTPIDIGTYTIVVTGKGGYTGTLSATYSITQLDITGATITYATGDYVYSGSAIKPEIMSIVKDGVTIPLDKVTVTYSNNIGASTTATITVTASSPFEGSSSVYFTIAKANLKSELTFKVGDKTSENGSLSVEYNGSAFAPTVTVYDSTGRLLDSDDYQIEYKRGSEITTNLQDMGNISIVVSPKYNESTKSTNLSGVSIGTLTISPIDMSSAVVVIEGEYYYNNVDITPTFKVYTDESHDHLVDATTYTYSFNNNKEAGVGSVIISFSGNYTGTAYQTFEIKQRDISHLTFTFTIPTLTYDGTTKTISWEVSDDNGASLDGQYSYTYSDNVSAGTATVTFDGLDNYTGKYEKTFTISPASIEDMTISSVQDQLYTGSAITPEVVVNIDSSSTLDSSNYTVTYSNNTLIGKATITVVGRGNYAGTLSTTFQITASDIALATITKISDVTYTGLAHKPKPAIYFGETKLLENTDYTLAYSNNINAGTATITITGIAGYSGSSTSATFKINPADISGIRLGDYSSEYTFTGEAMDTLHINNVYFNGILVPSTGDSRLISVAYANNVNVGTATITFTPHQSQTQPYLNFTGTKTITFEIVPATITYDMCEMASNQFSFTGASITPKPTITYGSYTLKENTDYTISYTADTTSVGTKTLTISAKDDGNFVGSVEMRYYIVAKSIEGVTIANIDAQTFTRSAITPTLNITDGEHTLTLDTEYTVEYTNNINVGTATVTIRGRGNYLNTTTKTTTFEIHPATVSGVTLDSITSVYNRRNASISANAVVAGDITLFADEYSLVYYRNNTTTTDLSSVGEIGVSINVLSDNFALETANQIFATYTITPAIINNITLNETSVTFNATSQAPEINKVLSINNIVLDSSEYTVSYFRGEAETSDFVHSGTITVKVASNSDNFKVEGDVTCEYTIERKSITDKDISIKYYFVTYDSDTNDYKMLDINGDGKKDYMSADQVYIAYLVHPEIIFNTATSIELIKGQAFTFNIVSSEEQSVETATEFISVGEYTTTITAIGDYTGTITDTFKVNPRNFTEENITIEFLNGEDFEYTGEYITFDLSDNLKLTYTQDGNTYEVILADADASGDVPAYRLYNKQTLTYIETVDGEDKSITITFEEGNYGWLNNINAGTGMLFLEGVGNFDGIICVEFNITPVDLSSSDDFDFALSNVDNLIYTGNAFRPVLETSTWKGEALVEGEDFVITYLDNIDASTSAKVVITGINNFTGSRVVMFTIKQKALESSMLLDISDVYYNGNEQKPTINLIYNSRTLIENNDYTISYNSDADFVNANEITITLSAVTGGNYSGSITHTYKILPRTLRNIVLSRSSAVYNRLAHNVTFVIRDMENVVVENNASNVKIEYFKSTDLNNAIDIVANPLIEAGEYIIQVEGLNNYTGTISATYTITKVTLSVDMMTSISSQTYTMSEITPSVTLKYLNVALEESDYTLAYSKNTDVGVAEIAISGKGNYTGSFTAYFNIVAKNLSDLQYNDETELEAEYTGLAVLPADSQFAGILKFGDYSLIKGQDYIVYTSNNCVNVGEYQLQIKGIGNYTGSLTKSFEINPMDISSTSIAIGGIIDKTYTGLAITQTLSITNTNSNISLYLSVDYLISYADNKDVVWGESTESAAAKITITGTGNYTGSRVEYFTITAKSLGDSDITVASIDPVAYTGDPHTPTPEVKFGNITLGENDIEYSYENNIEYGKASVIISAKEGSNFKGSITRYFEIGLTDMQGIEISGIVSTLVYNGQPQKQEPILTSEGKTLVLDTDYTLTYPSDITNAGEVVIRITGKGNYSGYLSAKYTITPLALTSDSVIISDIASATFTGSPITPSLSIEYNSKTLNMATDYTLSYENNTNVSGNATINITFVGNYSGSASKLFVITAKEISPDMVSGLMPKTYTGEEICPEFEMIYNGNNYLNDDMFTLSFRNNVSVGTAYIDIAGKGNFTGTITVSFEITAKTLYMDDIQVTLDDAYIYTGLQITPTFTVKYNNKSLTLNSDYTYTFGTNIIAGDESGQIFLEFTGNYAGNVVATFAIGRVDINSNLVTATIEPNVTFDGKTQISDYSLKYRTYTLNADDYTILYLRNGEETNDLINAGSVVIRLTGKGNYSGTRDLTYTINQKLLSSEDISVSIQTSDLTYTGAEIEPEIIVSMGTQILTENVDYIVTYQDNVSVSKSAKIVISGIEGANFQGTKEVLFEITPRALNVTFVQDIGNQVYTGSELTPNVILKHGDKTLIKDTDYTLTFADNTNIGTATVYITGTGNYTGSVSKTFNIIQADISSASVGGIKDSYVFTANNIKPIPTITIDGSQLEEGTDYTVSYTLDTINVGTKEITITGIGNYSGTKTIEYEITSKSLLDSDITIIGVENKPYNFGNEITQDFTLKHNDQVVYMSGNYTYSYSNNINAGQATLTITGEGNYTGTKTITFTITQLTSTAQVACADTKIYEGNPINLKLISSNVPGTIVVRILNNYVADEYTYNWTFEPTDSTNYASSSGTITLTAIPLSVTGLVFGGNYKKEYSAYDKLDTDNLIVSIEYNSGKLEVIDASKYTLSIAKGTSLHINDVVTVVYSLDESISARLPITISRRVISIASDIDSIVANDEKQYLNITFNNAEGLSSDKFEIQYLNLNTNTITDYILEKGLYRAIITILDENLLLEDREIEFEAKSKAIASVDNSLLMESDNGFGLEERINLVMNVDKTSVLQALGKSNFGIDGNFVAFYSFDLVNNQDVVIKFKPNVSDLTQLKVYKLENNNFTMVPFAKIGDDEISISCNSSDDLYLFTDVNDNVGAGGTSDDESKTLKLILIAFVAIVIIGLVISILASKIKKNQSTAYVKNIENTSVRRVENNANNNTMQNDKKSPNQDFKFTSTNTVTNTHNSPNIASQPHQINTQANTQVGTQTSTQSSIQTNTQANENIQPQRPKMSYEEMIRQYVIFDANGKVRGLKPNAPEALRSAYESLINENNKNQ